MKKGKLNNKGFVLVETLIVSVFVVSIFAILYNNFYPLMGEYEKRESYDDIDGKYATYWIKRIIEHESTDQSYCSLEGEHIYCTFNCKRVNNDSMKAMCHQLIQKAQIMNDNNNTPADLSDDKPHIYITTYNLANFKVYINDHGGLSGGMYKYLKYLPNYNTESLNNAKYRVIVEFYRTKDNNDYLAYSTFEVKK